MKARERVRNRRSRPLDGMVETRDKDIGLGIDRMLGSADQLLRGEFEGGAERLIGALGSRNDDRALVLVHRR